ncbi:probable tubulin polyglutamylase ttll-15 [Chironomus tepperi]|uniref:probable tubulin polyglutamylase ttll-15 n=1 Tax=Chironomus tepperi TaxID=113505 RepID=UPI00391F1EF8
MSPKKSQPSTKSSENWIFIILVGIIVILIAIICGCIFKPDDHEEANVQIAEKSTNVEEYKTLRYWTVVVDVWNEKGHFRTMERVCDSLQYKFVNASNGDDWDLLWTIDSPFYLPGEQSHPLYADVDRHPLRLEQKVNHFPGMEILSTKAYMNRNNAHLEYILPSFILPKDKKKLQEFMHKNPDAKLVEKNIFNRGVSIVDKSDIIYDDSDTFYQQFMNKPFLIDGHAFDFGVFVLITSFDPVRIYRFGTDVLFRFCKEKYYPFDAKNPDKYVVQEGMHPPFTMPTFENVYKRFQFPIIKHFEKIIAEKGFDVKKFWNRIDDAIVKIVRNSEPYITKITKDYNYSTHHFYELVRFDFIFDENLSPYVMEVNMSPNITPVRKIDEEYSKIYEQLMFNLVKMIGAGSYFEFMSRFNDSDVMIANKKNLAVDIHSCLKFNCHRSCEHINCKLCLPCINEENIFQMREAFREHLYQGNFRRLYPAKKFYFDEKFLSKLTEKNKFSLKWFEGKCLEDENWC